MIHRTGSSRKYFFRYQNITKIITTTDYCGKKIEVVTYFKIKQLEVILKLLVKYNNNIRPKEICEWPVNFKATPNMKRDNHTVNK